MISTITVKNPTEYFVPDISREYLTLTNPSMFCSDKQRMDGYETRLYYEYLDTIQSGGFCQYVTLTYNDTNIPTFYGFNCLDNSDIRSLFHDVRFFRHLDERHGYTFKYFCCSEFGEGGKTHNYVGKRGAGNNPHYHLILFFKPIKDWHSVDLSTGEVSYPHLSPFVSKFYINNYWQGSKWLYTKYNKGIVSYGKIHPAGLVDSFDALSYVSKYVCKDVYFKQSFIKLKSVLPIYFNRKSYGVYPFEFQSNLRESYVKEQVELALSEFKSRHSQRVLCSRGIGISALNHIHDPLNPVISVPTRKGSIERCLPPYLYQKLYYVNSKDKFGKFYRKLNSLGLDYKQSKLSDRLYNLAVDTYNNVKLLASDPDYFKSYIDSDDYSYPCPFTKLTDNFVVFSNDTFRYLNNLLNNNVVYGTSRTRDNLFTRFAAYETIYKDRSFRLTPFGDTPLIDYESDFKYSLKDTHKPMYHYTVYRPDTYDPDLVSYSLHPYFYQDLSLFSWLRSVNSFVCVQKDRVRKKSFEDYKRLRNIKFNINSYAH